MTMRPSALYKSSADKRHLTGGSVVNILPTAYANVITVA